jgi:hypothetical protein
MFLTAAVLSRWGTAKAIYWRAKGLLAVPTVSIAALEWYRSEGPRHHQPPSFVDAAVAFWPWWAWIIMSLVILVGLTFEGSHRELGTLAPEPRSLRARKQRKLLHEFNQDIEVGGPVVLEALKAMVQECTLSYVTLSSLPSEFNDETIPISQNVSRANASMTETATNLEASRDIVERQAPVLLAAIKWIVNWHRREPEMVNGHLRSLTGVVELIGLARENLVGLRSGWQPLAATGLSSQIEDASTILLAAVDRTIKTLDRTASRFQSAHDAATKSVVGRFSAWFRRTGVYRKAWADHR